MRILVLISLLSLIGVIKCLPQQILGQDIPVQAQIRYQNKLPKTQLPNLALFSSNRQQVVRKNISNNFEDSGSTNKVVGNFSNLPITVPNGSRVSNFLSRSNFQTLGNQKVPEKPLPSWRTHAILPDIKVPSSFPNFPNGKSIQRPSQNQRLESAFGTRNFGTSSRSIKSSTEERKDVSHHLGKSSNLQLDKQISRTNYEEGGSVAGTLGPKSSIKSSSDSLISSNFQLLREVTGINDESRSLESTFGTNSSAWLSTLTSLFKSRLPNASNSSNFLSGISRSLQNVSISNEDYKKRLRWRIFKSLFQRKLDEKSSTANFPVPLNVTSSKGSGTSSNMKESQRKNSKIHEPGKSEQKSSIVNVAVPLNISGIFGTELGESNR